jgi:hypothetical protein
MKTIELIYQGPFPELEIPIGQDRTVLAPRGKPVALPEHMAKEFLARGDFIEARQQRNGAATDSPI